jgi:3-dehydrosphinganine reductase
MRGKAGMKPGEHALITGGSSGIGLAIARRLVGRGMHATLIARGEQRLAEAVSALRADKHPGQTVWALTADVGDRAAIAAAVAEAAARLGPPHLVVTSAGVAHPGYFEELDDAVFETTMRVNYFGTLYTLRAALPAMRERGDGRVLLVSSAAGLVGVFGYTAYSPTKFALRGLAEALRGEVGRDGVGVSILYPPDTDTPQLAEENLTKPAETKRINASARMLRPDDVARAVEIGLKAGRFAITPGWETRVVHRFGSLIEPLLAWHFDREARRR